LGSCTLAPSYLSYACLSNTSTASCRAYRAITPATAQQVHMYCMHAYPQPCSREDHQTAGHTTYLLHVTMCDFHSEQISGQSQAILPPTRGFPDRQSPTVRSKASTAANSWSLFLFLQPDRFLVDCAICQFRSAPYDPRRSPSLES
jgi:hypothetical protein